ncbi:hypothetical protein AAHE18_04G167400 [Arachis hypogaea]
MDDGTATTADSSSLLKNPTVSEHTLQLLLTASDTSSLENSLESLTETAKSHGGRSELASKKVLAAVLEVLEHHNHNHDIIALCFKLLRNLCAGDIENQNSFIEHNGVAVVSDILRSEVGSSSSSYSLGLVRWGIQVLANVCLAGREHQRAVWEELYPEGFVLLARVSSKETCDPLCMVIYTCCDGNPEWFQILSSYDGWPVMAAIVRTASSAGFAEDWLKLLLSRICLEESQLPVLFPKLEYVDDPLGEEDTESKDGRGKSGLPSGSPEVDVLGYSLTILRDICAQDNARGNRDDAESVVDVLFSYGFIELLLSLLRDLEPPTTIRKVMKQFENQDGIGASSSSLKPCPYRGFRRDIVAVIGNCAYRRKHAQNEIRQQNGILLLLQQCVIDEDNPFLKEWGIWCVRNMLEGNEENRRVVEQLEYQGTAEVPELAALGLRVEVDRSTMRAKLVNVT